MAKKWAQKVNLKENALTKNGWPDAGKVVAAAKGGNLKTVVSRVVFLMNVTKDAATKAKCKSILARIKAGEKED